MSSTAFHNEYQYLEILRQLLVQSEDPKNLIQDRTGVGTYGLFGAQCRYDLTGGKLPLLTTKKVHFKSIVHELLWMISGSTNVKYLQENGVTIWDEWADKNGELGPVYGSQWRDWGRGSWEHHYYSDYMQDCYTQIRIDQLSQVIEQIKSNPHGRRHIVSAWNVADIPKMKLPPCHLLFQFHVDNENNLSCQMYQRSCDIFLGVPFNIVFYSLLTHMIAQQTGTKAKEFVHTLGDYHLYSNHVEQAELQLTRQILPGPTIEIAHRNSIDEYQYEDFKLIGYKSHPKIPAPVAK